MFACHNISDNNTATPFIVIPVLRARLSYAAASALGRRDGEGCTHRGPLTSSPLSRHLSHPCSYKVSVLHIQTHLHSDAMARGGATEKGVRTEALRLTRRYKAVLGDEEEGE